MNFLFPLYLLGAAAVAVPILLHLRKRPPKERTEFSSLMFLQATPAPLKRRRKLDHLLLLLLRCALILLLAFLFARPFFRGEGIMAGVGKSEWVVVLVDRSGSMQREDLWVQAVERAKDVVERRGGVDRMALVAFDRSPEVLLGFREWSETPEGDRRRLWGERLDGLEAGWGASSVGGALALAVELVEEEKANGEEPEKATVVLVSDLQEGLDMSGLDLVTWPEELAVELEGVEAKSSDNAWMQLLVSDRVLSPEEEAEDRAGAGDDEDGSEGLRVRVSNAAESGGERFRVSWEGAEASGQEVEVLPGRRRTVAVKDEGEGVAALVLEGDGQDFDNRVYVSRSVKRALRILWLEDETVDGDDAGEPLFYLSRAVQATRLHAPWVGQEAPPDLQFAGSVDVAVVGSAVSEDVTGALKAYLGEGGTVLMLLRDEEQGAALGELLGLTGVRIEEAEMKQDYVLLEDIDFENSLLRVFDDARVRNFSKVRFWKYRRLVEGLSWPEGTEVLARFDSGDPAWLSVPVGEGTLLVMASGWHPADSQLALSSKFVPLVYGLIEGVGSRGREGAQYLVGDALPVSGGATVTGPEGKPEVMEAGAVYYGGTEVPGIYEVRDEATATRYALNMDASESRTGVMDGALWAEHGVRLAGVERVPEEAGAMPEEAGEERRAESLNIEKERRQKGWRWLAVAALVVVLLETLLAGRLLGKPVAGEAVLSKGAG